VLVWGVPYLRLGAGELAQDVDRRRGSKRQQSALNQRQPRPARSVRRLARSREVQADLNGGTWRGDIQSRFLRSDQPERAPVEIGIAAWRSHLRVQLVPLGHKPWRSRQSVAD